MRLSPREIGAIKAAAVEAFGLDATVRLFGSRVEDAARGGDIAQPIEAAADIKEATGEAAGAAEAPVAQLAGLSAQNQFRRAEAIGGLPSADRWMELGATQNVLAHDYPSNPTAQAACAGRAWAGLPALTEGTPHVLRYLHAEGLLP